jgi:hypothetical protein
MISHIFLHIRFWISLTLMCLIYSFLAFPLIKTIIPCVAPLLPIALNNNTEPYIIRRSRRQSSIVVKNVSFLSIYIYTRAAPLAHGNNIDFLCFCSHRSDPDHYALRQTSFVVTCVGAASVRALMLEPLDKIFRDSGMEIWSPIRGCSFVGLLALGHLGLWRTTIQKRTFFLFNCVVIVVVPLS